MLSQFQNDLIDALPTEGGLFYLNKGTKTAYAQDAAMELAMLPLQGKEAAPVKRAIILHGAPGSGKTHAGYQNLEDMLGREPANVKNWVVISYDEHGAIFDIPEYVEAIRDVELRPNIAGFEGANDDTWKQRYQAWLDFQPLSQWVRSQTLKHALKDELSLYIDTTSSSAGTLKLIDTLRDLDYTHIEVWSYQGGLRNAAVRIGDRLRPTSTDDLLKKRVGAMEMLPQLVRYADRVEVFENSSDVLEPQSILTFEAGMMVSSHPQILGSTLSMIDHDKYEFERRAVEHLGKLEGANLTKRYVDAHMGLESLTWPALDSFLARAQSRAYSNDF